MLMSVPHKRPTLRVGLRQMVGLLLMATASTGLSQAELLAESAENLAPSALVDTGHPEIRQLAAGFIESHPRDVRARAVAIHDFVRDTVRFGWHGDFYEQTASEVLAGRVGFCNTKSTLFIALLRASGIPARQRFVDIDAAILAPIIDTGTPYVDHSYTEVWLNGAWIGVDSYIVDPALFAVAQQRLRAESNTMGYGVHRDGRNEWDGRRPAFAQFVQADPEYTSSTSSAETGAKPLSTRAYGIFADVRDFYARSTRSWNRAGWFVRTVFPVFAWRADRTLESLRTGGSN